MVTGAVCLGCGRALLGMRADALYCSPACRRSATRYGGADGPRIAQKAARYWRSYPAVTARQRPDRRQGEA